MKFSFKFPILPIRETLSLDYFAAAASPFNCDYSTRFEHVINSSLDLYSFYELNVVSFIIAEKDEIDRIEGVQFFENIYEIL